MPTSRAPTSRHGCNQKLERQPPSVSRPTSTLERWPHSCPNLAIPPGAEGHHARVAQPTSGTSRLLRKMSSNNPIELCPYFIERSIQVECLHTYPIAAHSVYAIRLDFLISPGIQQHP